MKKSNNKVSLQGVKRANKNLKRKQKKMAELEKHVDFLYKVLQAYPMDLNKLSHNRTTKEEKLIIDKLVSRGR